MKKTGKSLLLVLCFLAGMIAQPAISLAVAATESEVTAETTKETSFVETDFVEDNTEPTISDNALASDDLLITQQEDTSTELTEGSISNETQEITDYQAEETALNEDITSSDINQTTLVNVKDFGAVGDGITNDKPAIANALNYAAAHLPATVYFPTGQYGISSGGIYLQLPLGSGGLTVMGDGGGLSVIKYLEDWVPSGTWVALRILPVSRPSSEDEYLHDITISNLGVYDTDPVNHAWTVANNGSAEETHGFDIQYCIRAAVENCFINSVGDEAIDMVYCIDSVIANNTVTGSPGAGSAGGAISAGDGCKNVRIVNNCVSNSTHLSGKSNFGIAVEALTGSIENIVIADNTISNIQGYGINIGAPNGTIDGVVVDANIISDCSNGIRLMGKGQKTNIALTDNVIKNINNGIVFQDGASDNTIIDGFLIDGIQTTAIRIITPSMSNTIISNGTITNSQFTAIYNAGNHTKINNVLINGVGLAGNVTTAAILQYPSAGSCEVSKVTIKNCKNSKAIHLVETVIDTIIEQDEVSGYVSISGAKIIHGGKVNRMLQGLKNGATINGLEISTETNLGTHAIYLNGLTNCMITNCRIMIPSRYAIKENGSANNNIITNNITSRPIGIVGSNTVESGNIVA